MQNWWHSQIGIWVEKYYQKTSFELRAVHPAVIRRMIRKAIPPVSFLTYISTHWLRNLESHGETELRVHDRDDLVDPDRIGIRLSKRWRKESINLIHCHPHNRNVGGSMEIWLKYKANVYFHAFFLSAVSSSAFLLAVDGHYAISAQSSNPWPTSSRKYPLTEDGLTDHAFAKKISPLTDRADIEFEFIRSWIVPAEK